MKISARDRLDRSPTETKDGPPTLSESKSQVMMVVIKDKDEDPTAVATDPTTYVARLGDLRIMTKPQT